MSRKPSKRGSSGQASGNGASSAPPESRKEGGGRPLSGLPSFPLLWILLLAILAGPSILRWIGVLPTAGPDVDYSLFRRQLEQGNVARIVARGRAIEGEFRSPVELEREKGSVDAERFSTYLPAFGDDGLHQLLRQQKVSLRAEPEADGMWQIILVITLPVLLLVGLGLLAMRRKMGQAGSLFGFGRNRARRYDRTRARGGFDEVAGAEGAKGELREIVEFLQSPARFQSLGGRPPRGVLLVGPPGTGKTLLARATAAEAGVAFFSITGSDFMEMFVGVGASRVRDLFRDARSAAPSIVFVDELDSIGRRRGTGLGGGHDEREQTLNQLLSEMDGFEPNEGVIVMAATNRPDILDPALLRPGRFDRRIGIEMPGLEARRAILQIHAKNKPLAGDVDLAELAKGTSGFSGADLSNLLNEAALIAARGMKTAIGREDVEEARDKILLGLKREGLALSDEERRMIAFHEAGHAVVAATLPHADPVRKVTVVPRGHAMGVTQQDPKRDRYLCSRAFALDRLAVMMGGRAAESLALETSTSGSEQDLKGAVRLARRMVLDWGMSDRLGPLALGGEDGNVFLGQEIARGREYSDDTARLIDEEIREIVGEGYARAETTLKRHRRILDELAAALVEEEEISGERLAALLETDGESTGAE